MKLDPRIYTHIYKLKKKSQNKDLEDSKGIHNDGGGDNIKEAFHVEVSDPFNKCISQQITYLLIQ